MPTCRGTSPVCGMQRPKWNSTDPSDVMFLTQTTPTTDRYSGAHQTTVGHMVMPQHSIDNKVSVAVMCKRPHMEQMEHLLSLAVSSARSAHSGCWDVGPRPKGTGGKAECENRTTEYCLLFTDMLTVRPHVRSHHCIPRNSSGFVSNNRDSLTLHLGARSIRTYLCCSPNMTAVSPVALDIPDVYQLEPADGANAA